MLTAPGLVLWAQEEFGTGLLGGWMLRGCCPYPPDTQDFCKIVGRSRERGLDKSVQNHRPTGRIGLGAGSAALGQESKGGEGRADSGPPVCAGILAPLRSRGVTSARDLAPLHLSFLTCVMITIMVPVSQDSCESRSCYREVPSTVLSKVSISCSCFSVGVTDWDGLVLFGLETKKHPTSEACDARE